MTTLLYAPMSFWQMGKKIMSDSMAALQGGWGEGGLPGQSKACLCHGVHDWQLPVSVCQTGAT